MLISNLTALVPWNYLYTECKSFFFFLLFFVIVCFLFFFADTWLLMEKCKLMCACGGNFCDRIIQLGFEWQVRVFLLAWRSPFGHRRPMAAVFCFGFNRCRWRRCPLPSFFEQTLVGALGQVAIGGQWHQVPPYGRPCRQFTMFNDFVGGFWKRNGQMKASEAVVLLARHPFPHMKCIFFSFFDAVSFL